MAPPDAPGRAEDVGTAPVETDLHRIRRARTARRVMLAVLALVLLAGLSTLLGARTDAVSASGGGLELTVTYPKVSRPSLAIRWIATVSRPGGFDRPIDLAITSRYLDLFDFNNFDPSPSKTTTAGELSVWTFDPPVGDTLTVSMDARVEPAQQFGKDAVTAVLVQGRPVVQVRYRTWVLP